MIIKIAKEGYVNLRLLFFTIFVCFVAQNISSQKKFEHISINEGLSNNSIRTIMQSQEGYLWFGTLNGLNRYDGKEIRSFIYEPGNKKSLSSDRIYFMFEDSLNYIWLLTYDYQVLRFNPQTEKFIHINPKLPEGMSLGRSHVGIFASSPTRVWITSNEGVIIRVKQKKDSEEMEFDFFSDKDIFTSDKETFIFKDTVGKIWFGTQKGLFALENDSISISSLKKSRSHIIDSVHYFNKYYEISPNNILFGTDNKGLYEYKNGSFNVWSAIQDTTIKVRDIKEGKSNDILISTQGSGLYYVNKDKVVRNLKYDNVSNYYKIFCDHEGIFWILTQLRGVVMFNPEKNVLKHFDLHSENRESLGETDKQKFLEDKWGNVWIGIYGGGLFKFNRELEEFEYFYHDRNNTNSLSSNFVISLFEDNSENLWIGTFKGGLNKLNLSESFFQYKELEESNILDSKNNVRCIAEDFDQRVWVGTKYGNIYCCDKNNNILFTIPDDLKNEDEYIRSNVYAILPDGNNLWVGTKGNGLYHIKGVLDFDGKKDKRYEIEVYRHSDDDPNSLAFDDIYSLYQDQYGQIWVGTYHGGLSIIRNSNVKISFKNYSRSDIDSNSLSDNRVRKIYQDRNNNIWIGTVNGLNYLDSKYIASDQKKFVRYFKDASKVNSLANNDILDIHQDLNNTLWVATYGGGLNSMNIQKDTVIFNHYFRKDGLPSNIALSILEDKKLNLWIGTDNGLAKFSAQEHTIELIDNNDGLGHSEFTESCRYKAKNGDLLFGTVNGYIRFNPDSIFNKQNNYPILFTAFKLFNEVKLPEREGSPLKKSINETEHINLKHNQNSIGIDFAVMDFKYPEKIQYSYILENYDEKWNTVIGKSNAVYKGIPPGKYTFKLKATDSKGKWMDEMRTIKIVIEPPFWKSIWAYILYLIVIVVIYYFIISEIRVRHKIKYENILSEEKFKFFTNISHEFKTPLTLINNSVDDIVKAKSFTKDVRNSINLVKKNAEYLNRLIEQLIDFRRLQNGKLDLRVKKIEIIAYLNDIYLTFLPFAEKKKIKFLFKSDIPEQDGLIDVRHVDKILNNLISNALKHSPSNHKVKFTVSVLENAEKLKIEIADEGKGISKEYIDKVFERFMFIENDMYSNLKGSGIGLSLTKELVHLHKGTISLTSKENEGSVFTIEIPIDQSFYEEDEFDNTEVGSFLQQRKPFFTYDSEEEERHGNTQLIKTTYAVKSKLLIIDDNEELRGYLVDKLSKEYSVVEAINGEEGIKLAEEVNPDLIITDVKMPKLDGIELTKHIKNNFETSHIPIILLTGKSSLSSQIEGIDSGADDYITKPFNLEYLRTRIVNIINQRKQLKEKFSKEPGFKPEKLTTSNKDQEFLSQVIETVEKNIKTPNYTIEDVITELNITRSFFFKKMKSVSGYAPKEFIRIVKMKKAAELLRNPDTTITQVSYETGFSDPDYFSKSFKNFFGETPTSYKKKYS